VENGDRRADEAQDRINLIRAGPVGQPSPNVTIAIWLAPRSNCRRWSGGVMQNLDCAHTLDRLFDDARRLLDLANEITAGEFAPSLREKIDVGAKNLPNHLVSNLKMFPDSGSAILQVARAESLRSMLNFALLVGAASGMGTQIAIKQFSQIKSAARATDAKRKASRLINDHILDFATSFLPRPKYNDFRIATQIQNPLNKALEKVGIRPLKKDAIRKRITKLRTDARSST
jgi:hypothetical protein